MGTLSDQKAHKAIAPGTLLVADGTSLKRRLARSLRREKIRALLLIAPLLIFILVTFLLPIADMLFRSVENGIVAETLPQTIAALAGWEQDATEIPNEAVFAALATDLQIAVAAKKHTRLGNRLNYEMSGMSSLFRKSGQQIKHWNLATAGSFQDRFAAIDPGWTDVAVWQILSRFSPKYTSGYFLHAVDLKKGSGGVESRAAEQRIYITLFQRTLFMSLTIMLACILLGYPVAFLLASVPTKTSNLLLILVLLPFWTSLLVRTSAWKVLLQQQGVINDTLVWLGLVDDGARLILINNQFGTIVAMTHILLPYMILPLYSVMQTIPTVYVRAARSLGATHWTTFWRVYFPQTMPGIGAGCLLVFILAIGYYITPELVGGTKGVFISNRIAYHISSSLNWGLAAALGTILLAAVLVLYWSYDKILGIDRVKLG